MLILVLTGTAVAFTADRLGGYVDFGLGAGLGPSPAVAMGVGFWRGKYDDELSFGRFWSLGVGIAQVPSSEAVRTEWLLEARRGMDLIVGGVHGFAAVGPVLLQGEEEGTGLAARVGGAAEFRRTSTLGLALRLEGGIDVVNGEVSPAGILTLGIQTVFARETR